MYSDYTSVVYWYKNKKKIDNSAINFDNKQNRIEFMVTNVYLMNLYAYKEWI